MEFLSCFDLNKDMIVMILRHYSFLDSVCQEAILVRSSLTFFFRIGSLIHYIGSFFSFYIILGRFYPFFIILGHFLSFFSLYWVVLPFFLVVLGRFALFSLYWVSFCPFSHCIGSFCPFFIILRTSFLPLYISLMVSTNYYMKWSVHRTF